MKFPASIIPTELTYLLWFTGQKGSKYTHAQNNNFYFSLICMNFSEVFQTDLL